MQAATKTAAAARGCSRATAYRSGSFRAMNATNAAAMPRSQRSCFLLIAVADSLAGVLHCHLVVRGFHVHFASVRVIVEHQLPFGGRLMLLAVHLPGEDVPLHLEFGHLAPFATAHFRDGVFRVLRVFFGDAAGEGTRRHLHAL